MPYLKKWHNVSVYVMKIKRKVYDITIEYHNMVYVWWAEYFSIHQQHI